MQNRFDWPLFSKMKVMMIALMPFYFPRVHFKLETTVQQCCQNDFYGNSGFFYYSVFTSNQFLGFWKCKISHSNTFRGSDFFIVIKYWYFLKAQKMAKIIILELLDSPKLIALKI